MNKETRAIVLGLFVVVLFALGLSFWRGPARDFQKIRGFRVEVRTKESDETRRMSFNVPVALLAQLTRIARIDDAIDGDVRAAWDNQEITPKQILEAADQSTEEKPGMIEHDDTKVEVRRDGDAILLDIHDDWDKKVHIRVPRSLIEVFADDRPISTRDILRRLDELDPGDVVTIRDRDNEVTITAQPKRKGIHISGFERLLERHLPPIA
jgi:hypothetical protein